MNSVHGMISRLALAAIILTGAAAAVDSVSTAPAAHRVAADSQPTDPAAPSTWGWD